MKITKKDLIELIGILRGVHNIDILVFDYVIDGNSVYSVPTDLIYNAEGEHFYAVLKELNKIIARKQGKNGKN